MSSCQFLILPSRLNVTLCKCVCIICNDWINEVIYIFTRVLAQHDIYLGWLELVDRSSGVHSLCTSCTLGLLPANRLASRKILI
jgi:hypothetical protein